VSDNESQPNDELVLARLLRLTQPRTTAPAAVEATVRARVREEWLRETASRRRRRPMIAATLITGLAASLVVWIGGWWPSVPLDPAATVLRSTGTVRVDRDGDARGWRPLRSTEVAPGSRLATDGSGRLALRLASGVSVRLDHGTALDIEAADRLALERGRIYIDTHGTGAGRGSVRVRTSLGTVRDFGTQFEVAHVDESVRVRVREGAIVVDATTARIHGGSGEEVLIQPDGSVARARVEPFGDHWAWVGEIAPSFDTDGRTVLDILAWIASETGRELQFADRPSEQAARAAVLHGSVQGVTPTEALAKVLRTTRLREVGDERVLLIELREPAASP
jgi:ferric-dicitrate binding protein FerR (iron transport regulator)